MHGSLARITFVAFLCLSGAVTAASTSTLAAKEAIQAQYEKGTQAMLAEDANGYAAICTPDAIFIAPHKKPETLRELKSHIGPNPDPQNVVSTERQTIRRVRINPSGRRATVDAEDVSLGTMAAPNGNPGHKMSQWSLVIRRKDLWVKQNTTWRLKKSTIKPGSVLRVDGKVVYGDLSP